MDKSMIVHTGYNIWASAFLYLFFAKPNMIVNTDLLIILCNYFSLICIAEILYPPQLYLKRFILYVRSLDDMNYNDYLVVEEFLENDDLDWISIVR